MGDLITQVNKNSLRNPDDLTRIISMAKKKVRFEGKDSSGK